MWVTEPWRTNTRVTRFDETSTHTSRLGVSQSGSTKALVKDFRKRTEPSAL